MVLYCSKNGDGAFTLHVHVALSTLSFVLEGAQCAVQCDRHRRILTTSDSQASASAGIKRPGLRLICQGDMPGW